MGNAVVRLKEYRLEGETVHQQFLKAGQQYICVLLRLRVYFPGGYKGLAELSETSAFPKVLCKWLGHGLGCSFAHPHTSTKQLQMLVSPLGPAPHGSPHPFWAEDTESSGDLDHLTVPAHEG